MLRTKINVNLGVSRDCKDYDIEMQKVQSAMPVENSTGICSGNVHSTLRLQKQFETTALPSMMTPVQCAENSVQYAV